MTPPRSGATATIADEPATVESPLSVADALGRTAAETCRQHERLARLNDLEVSRTELAAAHALVDTIDLALAECVRAYEKICAKHPSPDDSEMRQLANTLWLAARDYLRRHSIAEQASRQLTQHSAEKFGVLKFEYELEASAMLSLRQASNAYAKLRPTAR